MALPITIPVLIGIAVLVLLLAFTLVSRINAVPYQGEPDDIDWNALKNPQVWSLLPVWHNQEAAAEAYAEFAGVSLSEAQKVIAYVVRYWNQLDIPPDKKHASLPPLDIPEELGIRQMMAEGRLQEAAQAYAEYADVDQFTAQEAIRRMQ